MRVISIFISCLLIAQTFTNPTSIEEQKKSIQVFKHSPCLSYSAEFLLQNDNDCLEKIIRTGFMCPRYFYELFDEEDNFAVRGITRAFSWGLVFTRATDIDIYDNQDNFIGMIEGKILKMSRIQFNFYDANNNLVAIAYINYKTKDVTITSPDNPDQIFAKFTGLSFEENGSLNIDFIAEDCSIDDGLIKVFSAFIFDFYEKFMYSDELIEKKRKKSQKEFKLHFD